MFFIVETVLNCLPGLNSILAFISLKNSHKDEGIELAKELIKLSFKLSATKGTAEYIKKHGMKCKIINKVSSGSPHIVDILNSKKIALVINTGGGDSEHRLNVQLR